MKEGCGPQSGQAGRSSMTETTTERKEWEMNVNKIEHKDVRVILDPEKAAKAPPDVKKEGKLIDLARRRA